MNDFAKSAREASPKAYKEWELSREYMHARDCARLETTPTPITDLRPGAVNWVEGSGGSGGHCDWYTDGQGNSWGHFPEQAWFNRIHKWVIFLMGLQIGALLSAVLCYVSW